MSVLYNEILPYPAQWLCNLIDTGVIAEGDVLQRDIRNVSVQDLKGYDQCHFFAGLGIWSYALRLAGWPDELPVWTGSAPCQPWSIAGRRKGKDDERHLWPEWFRLIQACRPPIAFGEQVASADGYKWFDLVSTDLEADNYSVEAVNLPAASVGAPHRRYRLYFVAYAREQRRSWLDALLRSQARRPGETALLQATRRGAPGSLANTHGSFGNEGCEISTGCGDRSGAYEGARLGGGSKSSGLANTGSHRLQGSADTCSRQRASVERGRFTHASSVRGDAGVTLGDTGITRSGWNPGAVLSAEEESTRQRIAARAIADELVPTGSTRGFWADAKWLPCIDGKARCVEPSTFVMAPRTSQGVVGDRPSRSKTLHGSGNALVAPLAATFIRAFLDTCFDAAEEMGLGFGEVSS